MEENLTFWYDLPVFTLKLPSPTSKDRTSPALYQSQGEKKDEELSYIFTRKGDSFTQLGTEGHAVAWFPASGDIQGSEMKN
jgi:hypothetical protein